MSNEDLLWAFCTAAGHPATCQSWEEHRRHLDDQDRAIHQLIDSIPDIMALGKASQKAADAQQDTLLGSAPVKPPVIQDFRDATLPAVDVHWNSPSHVNDWWTADPHIIYSRNPVYREDCRSLSIAAYKPRRVQIFFNGEPDDWNEYR